MVGRYAGQIQQWDIANEIFDSEGNLRTEENIWIRELGPGIIADAFRWAHQADPEVNLFFNDYGVEANSAKSDAYYELIQEYLAQGIPVDGFAVQGHLSMRYGFPAGLEANLQRFDDLGLETAITEIDVRMDLPNGATPTAAQLEKQASYYQRALEACLGVEGCNSSSGAAWTNIHGCRSSLRVLVSKQDPAGKFSNAYLDLFVPRDNPGFESFGNFGNFGRLSVGARRAALMDHQHRTGRMRDARVAH